MTLVVDANVAVKWFVTQPDSDHARRVQAYAGPLIAPAMLISETVSTIWRYLAPGDIGPDQAKAAVASLPRWFTELVDDRQLAGRAMDLAIELGYVPYGFFYLALAIERNAPLVTADRRLINRLSVSPYASRLILLEQWTG